MTIFYFSLSQNVSPSRHALNGVSSLGWTQPWRHLKRLVQILIMSLRTIETSFQACPSAAGKEKGLGPPIGSFIALLVCWLLRRVWYFLRTQTLIEIGHTATDVASFQMCGLPLTFVISPASTFIKKPFLLKGFSSLNCGLWPGEIEREECPTLLQAAEQARETES